MVTQLQHLLDETECLYPFQAGFWPSYGMETAFVLGRKPEERPRQGECDLAVPSRSFSGIRYHQLWCRSGASVRLGDGWTVLRRTHSFLSDRSIPEGSAQQLLFKPVVPEIWGTTGLNTIPYAF